MAQSVATKTVKTQKGRALSAETRARISAAKKGRPLSPETRARISEAGKGREVSPETRARISAAHKGRAFSPEHRAKLSAARKGRPPASPETRARMSEAQKSRQRGPHSPETRARISAALQGRQRGPHSPETRARISAALQGRTNSPEHCARMSAARKGGRFIPRDLADQLEAILKHQAEGSTQAPTARPESATSADPALPKIRLGQPGESVFVDGREEPPLTKQQHRLASALLDAGVDGLGSKQLSAFGGGWRESLSMLRTRWPRMMIFPGRPHGHYRLAAARATAP